MLNNLELNMHIILKRMTLVSLLRYKEKLNWIWLKLKINDNCSVLLLDVIQFITREEYIGYFTVNLIVLCCDERAVYSMIQRLALDIYIRSYFHFVLVSSQFNSYEQEELKSIEGLQPSSRSCKEYVVSIFSTCAFISTCSVLLKSCAMSLCMFH